MGNRKGKQLKFEDYLSFFGNCRADNLTTSQLNQILFLHGFQKLTYSRDIGLTKEEIIVAVSSLNLIPPTRFGMSDGNIHSLTTSMSALSHEEVKHDMRQIGWEECPVGSILTINPAAVAVADNSTSIPTSQKKRRGKANRSRNDERRDLQSSVAEEGANKDVKELSNRISGEIATIQVLAKSIKNADPYTWRASGSMRITGLPHYRRYYKCSEIGCFAKRHIDHDANDPSMRIITYKGQHNHTIP